jgi:alanine dehydrogenase
VIVGLPRESKAGERRVALVPSAVRELVAAGHAVRVARGAGEGAGHPDSQYASAGALLVAPEDAWRAALVVKVKEIQPGEEAMLAPGTLVFAFQHLVGEPEATRALAARGVDAIAFELVRGFDGGFPILAPMSVIAGRLAVQAGAHHLTVPGGGAGVLLAGAPGSDPARVLVLGGGHAGASAALAAAAMGAEVTVLTRSEPTRDRLWSDFDGRAAVDLATPENIAALAPDMDLVIGAVFVPGEPTPKLLPRTVVASMRPGRVIVDVSIDAGGGRGDLAPHDACGPGVRRGRRRPLCRRQHARRRAAGRVGGAVLGDPAVRALAGQRPAGRGPRGRSRPRRRSRAAPGRGHAPRDRGGRGIAFPWTWGQSP